MRSPVELVRALALAAQGGSVTLRGDVAQSLVDEIDRARESAAHTAEQIASWIDSRANMLIPDVADMWREIARAIRAGEWQLGARSTDPGEP